MNAENQSEHKAGKAWSKFKERVKGLLSEGRNPALWIAAFIVILLSCFYLQLC